MTCIRKVCIVQIIMTYFTEFCAICRDSKYTTAIYLQIVGRFDSNLEARLSSLRGFSINSKWSSFASKSLNFICIIKIFFECWLCKSFRAQSISHAIQLMSMILSYSAFVIHIGLWRNTMEMYVRHIKMAHGAHTDAHWVRPCVLQANKRVRDQLHKLCMTNEYDVTRNYYYHHGLQIEYM